MTTIDYIARAQAALKAGFTSKAAQQDALADINRAFDLKTGAIRDELLKVPHAERGEKHNELYWGLPDYPHNWKAKHSELFASNGFGALVNEIEAIVRFRAVVKEASVNRPAPKAPVTAAPEEKRMTCQCCGRAIQANTGKIAHHGYQRPGLGWQTASCEGAQELPFEVSRDALGRYIEGLNRRLDNRAERIRQHGDEEITELTLAIIDREQPRQYGRPERTLFVRDLSAETFEAKAAEYGKSLRAAGIYKFKDALDRDLREARTEAALIQTILNHEEPRWANWKQTHEWTGTEFKAI